MSANRELRLTETAREAMAIFFGASGARVGLLWCGDPTNGTSREWCSVLGERERQCAGPRGGDDPGAWAWRLELDRGRESLVVVGVGEGGGERADRRRSTAPLRLQRERERERETDWRARANKKDNMTIT